MPHDQLLAYPHGGYSGSRSLISQLVVVHDVVPWPVSEIFDATSIDTTSHEPIKAGTYEAVITASEIKANRANTGKIPLICVMPVRKFDIIHDILKTIQ